MRFTKHSYVYSFERAERLFDKVYYEVELEEGDTIEDAEKTVIEKCKEIAAKMQNEMFYGGKMNPYVVDGFRYGNNPPSIPKEEPKEQRIGTIASDILSCDSIKLLETYRFIKDTNDELRVAYQRRYDELMSAVRK